MLPITKMLVVYWLHTVGAGSGLNRQIIHVPLTDVLQYKRADGSPQANVVNLTGSSIAIGPAGIPYLQFDTLLMQTLQSGQVKQLQYAGIKVVLCIQGNGKQGFGDIPADKAKDFASYLKNDVLDKYGLDGIDVDDEYPTGGNSKLEPVVAAMRRTFKSGTILSKALYLDYDMSKKMISYFDYGGIMDYGDSAAFIENVYYKYLAIGWTNNKLLIGVNAGPVVQKDGAFTSVATVKALTKWQPETGKKRGMMLWSFSQDIQQYTHDPQNDPQLLFPNPNDHEWQRAIMVGLK
jgi:chitinase